MGVHDSGVTLTSVFPDNTYTTALLASVAGIQFAFMTNVVTSGYINTARMRPHGEPGSATAGSPGSTSGEVSC